ncbi:MAG: hypothetical protein ACJ78Q_10380 [Chloroflexia bacterium]
MDALRTLRRRNTSKLKIKKTTPRTRRLGPRDRALADALDQLGQGVPLNWTQLEDDPELAVLASLGSAAMECREQAYPTPPGLRRDLFQEWAARLPEPKQAPVQEQPRALAGYSENVYVPPQAEEEVPTLSATMLPRIARAVAITAAVGILLWLVSTVMSIVRPTPTYTWISVRKNGQTVFPQNLPLGWSPPTCTNSQPAGPTASRSFITFPNKNQLQLSVGFPVEFLPSTLTLSTTNSVALTDQAVSPCTEDVPDPADVGALVKLNYITRRQMDPSFSATAPLTVFEAKQLPLAIDVPSGDAKEVKIGNVHGIYWHGGPYQDPEGTHWIGDVSVMLLEKGDMAMLLVGEVRQGITEEMLTGLVRQMVDTGQEQSGQNGKAVPTFTWIEVTRGTTVVAARQPATNPAQIECQAVPGKWSFVRGGAVELTQPYLGFPIVPLPDTTVMTGTIDASRTITGPDPTPPTTIIMPTTAVLTYTAFLTSGSVSPCQGTDLVPADAGARLKRRYAIRRTSGYVDNVNTIEQTVPASDIVTFQLQRQPVRIDIATGTWKEVRAGDFHGIYWKGSPYTDMEGIAWSGDVGVLTAEKGDTIITLVGTLDPVPMAGSTTPIPGVTEELMVALLKGMP